MGLRITSNKVPSSADVAGLGTTLWQIPVYMYGLLVELTSSVLSEPKVYAC